MFSVVGWGIPQPWANRGGSKPKMTPGPVFGGWISARRWNQHNQAPDLWAMASCGSIFLHDLDLGLSKCIWTVPAVHIAVCPNAMPFLLKRGCIFKRCSMKEALEFFRNPNPERPAKISSWGIPGAATSFPSQYLSHTPWRVYNRVL